MSSQPTADIPQWLEGLGLEQYAEAFARNHVTAEDLPGLTGQDLKDCGVEVLGHRKLILESIRQMGETAVVHEVPAEPAVSAVPDAFVAQDEEEAVPETASHFVSEPASPVWTPAEMPAMAPARSAAVYAPAPALPEAPLWPQPKATRRPRPRSFWAGLLASKFFLVSVAVHILFGLGATYFIVSRMQAKRQVAFQGGPPSINPSKRALEHKVAMAQKKKSGGAPPQAKRIVTNGISKVSLPDLPSLPSATTIVPGMAAGMGGAGFGGGMGIGNGMGSGMGGGFGGGGLPMFGFRTATAGTLVGYLYDLKQSVEGGPTGMDTGKYHGIVSNSVRSGFDEKIFDDYFKSPKPLYTTQIFIPGMQAEEAPKAFNVDKGPHKVEPKMWVAVYRGKVIAPATGAFRFVGFADDILCVRFDGKVVLDAGCGSVGGGVDRSSKYTYENFMEGGRQGFYAQFGSMRGTSFQVEAGKPYDIEILIGEEPGGFFCAHLLIEQEDAQYSKDTKSGNPKLPIFQLARGRPPKTKLLPPFAADNNLIWRGTSTPPAALGTKR